MKIIHPKKRKKKLFYSDT